MLLSCVDARDFVLYVHHFHPPHSTILSSRGGSAAGSAPSHSSTMPVVLPSVEWLLKRALRFLVRRHLGPLLRSEVGRAVSAAGQARGFSRGRVGGDARECPRLLTSRLSPCSHLFPRLPGRPGLPLCPAGGRGGRTAGRAAGRGRGGCAGGECVKTNGVMGDSEKHACAVSPRASAQTTHAPVSRNRRVRPGRGWKGRRSSPAPGVTNAPPLSHHFSSTPFTVRPRLDRHVRVRRHPPPARSLGDGGSCRSSCSHHHHQWRRRVRDGRRPGRGGAGGG